MHRVGYHNNLRVTAERPQRTLGRGGADWSAIAGKTIPYIDSVNQDDKMYRVRMVDGTELWLEDAWVVALPKYQAELQDWRDVSLSENARQMAHAAAYQNMLWREMGPDNKRHAVGDQVRIKGYAGIKSGFPDSFVAEHYNAMMGRKGKIISASRHIGSDGKMYRTYAVRIQLNTLHYTDVWYTGDDLE
jgi:hypothetical protein